MGKVLGGMTMSLDGFVNDRNGSVARLYPDLGELRETEMLRESIDTTGAVVMGKRAYEMGDQDEFADYYEYQVPIFVLTHYVPEKMPKRNENLTFTFVTDGIESAIKQAKAAAGEKTVSVIGGASTIQQSLKVGLLDEIQIGIMPVLLGEGLRFFEQPGMESIGLEKIRVIESAGGRTDILFRVVK
jgi:dihydrofolate reductase